jgi:hypothetical protein
MAACSSDVAQIQRVIAARIDQYVHRNRDDFS